MASAILVPIGIQGLTLTADLFPLSSDTAVATGLELTEEANAKGWYTGSHSGTETGRHRVVLKESGTAIGGGWINLQDGLSVGRVEYFDAALDAVDADRISGDSDAADNLKYAFLSIESAQVATADDAANTATEFDTTLPQQSANYYGNDDGGLVIGFISGTTNPVQTRRIVSSVDAGPNTRITVEEAFADVPGVGDRFVILGRVTELFTN